MSETNFRTAKEAKGLQVGEKVKNFQATDLHGASFDLSDTLKKGSLVLIFYRGHWCPICNSHLKELEKNLKKIFDKGAQVVAISPEKSEFLRRTAEKTDVSFRLLYDENYTISKLFDVHFKPSTLHKVMYNTMLGAKLKQAHSDDSEQLPIPATFILDTDGVIVWRHFNPDYKKRSSVADIVANLP
ncbi:peroxiredoxin-like family protein [Arenibacter sp. GZD96]|uniref:peroxiredoxin-like family protein n=1 Tax=Aurantibrevibacter litoralis TaxID=3106030 RepID=UPI002B001B26|nr:peroxiredoxin-like family protein [Arenibacter sp. GZD-96]MEA1787184.1 peroxiredoxin-like family protein [Arenibacter sp. GZD-96]